jgi:hypothetical protein
VGGSDSGREMGAVEAVEAVGVGREERDVKGRDVLEGLGWPKTRLSTSSSSEEARFAFRAASTSPDVAGLAYSRMAAGEGSSIPLSAFATGERGERMPGMMMGESTSAAAAAAAAAVAVVAAVAAAMVGSLGGGMVGGGMVG